MRPLLSAPTAVVGGGIAGLTVAHRLGGRAMVLEASGRLGGKVRTVTVGGARVEGGADSFVVRKPWAVDLCSELGLDDRVVVPGSTGAFVRLPGGLVPLPERSAFGIPGGAGVLLAWEGLPRRARWRALADLVLPARRSDEDEALGRLLRRRLGTEAARVLVEPLLAGLHVGDPLRLSVRATFPELATWERDHGSLIRGARAATDDAPDRPEGRAPMFATVWGGLDGLIEALAARLPGEAARTDWPVASMTRSGDGYRLQSPGGEVEAATVVLATPAFESARLLRDLNPAAAAELDRISYVSTAAVVLVYPDGTAGRLPGAGTGYVVPARSGLVTACTWLSRKWPSDEFGDRAVVRCFVGRDGDRRALDLDDGDLADRVRAEVEAVTPLGAEPEAVGVVRWERSMPQYGVGHVGVVERIGRALEDTPGVFVTGSAYRGVGIADCVRRAGETAERVRAFVDGSARAGPRDADEEATWTT